MIRPFQRTTPELHLLKLICQIVQELSSFIVGHLRIFIEGAVFVCVIRSGTFGSAVVPLREGGSEAIRVRPCSAVNGMWNPHVVGQFFGFGSRPGVSR